MSYAHPEFLVDVAWLVEHGKDENLVVVDCPWDVWSYNRAHIPGAVVRPGHPYIKTRDEEANPGLHLPDAEEFADLANELGIRPDTTVVAYDEWGSIFAARLWWLLKYWGHTDVRILNGGWQAWVSAGHPVSLEIPKVSRGAFEPKPASSNLVTTEELKERHADDTWNIWDVRSEEEYVGTESSGNERVGHIPGARHLEWCQVLTNSNDAEAIRTFRSGDEIRAMLEENGISFDKTVVTHCQAAVRGAFGAFVLELLGHPDPRLYDGSMGEWANRDDTPLAVVED